MPKKRRKRGGGRKEVAMKDECQLNLEQRIKAEDEMAKQRQKMLMETISAKNQKEEQYSATNLHKLTGKWRAILQQTKAQELRRDIDALTHSFERTVDHKNSVIESLVDSTNKARQQSDQSLRSSRQNLDLLLDLHKNRVDSLNQVFSTELDELRAQFNAEREQIMTQHQQDITHLQDVMSYLDEQHCKLQSEAQQDLKISCLEMKNQHERKGKAEQMQLLRRLMHTWQDVQKTTKHYFETVCEKRATCESLKSSVESHSTEIHNNANKLQKMQKSVEALQTRMKTNEEKSKETIAALKMCVGEEKRKGIEQNAQLHRFQAKQEAKLTTMLMQKRQASKKLQGITEKATKVIKRAEACRKLETRSEKEQPLYRSSVSSEELRLVMAHQEGNSELAKVMNDYKDLQGVWDRHSKVQLENFCLQQYKGELIQEQQRLQALIRQKQSTGQWQSNSPLLANRFTPSQWQSTTLQGTCGPRH